MRRMYSEQELTKIIGEVFDSKLEAGAFDDSISDAVDAYLVEHPVDITALEGKTIAPAVVNATTSISAPAGTFTSLNGESSPSVKPNYCHPIQIDHLDGSSVTAKITFLIFNNSSTRFTKETFLDFLDSLYSVVGDTIRIMASGGFKTTNTVAISSYLGKSSYGYYLTGINAADGSEVYVEYDRSEFLSYIRSLEDGVNKIN